MLFNLNFFFLYYKYNKDMPLTKEERIELLAKARQKKKELAEERKNISNDETPIKKKEQKKEQKKTLNISTVEDIKKLEEDFEIKNEVIRIKAPKKKTIIKRVIEVEEPSSEEEVQEEIITVPKSNKKINKVKEINEMKEETVLNKKNELKQNLINSRLYRDIFPQ